MNIIHYRCHYCDYYTIRENEFRLHTKQCFHMQLHQLSLVENMTQMKEIMSNCLLTMEAQKNRIQILENRIAEFHKESVRQNHMKTKEKLKEIAIPLYPFDDWWKKIEIPDIGLNEFLDKGLVYFTKKIIQQWLYEEISGIEQIPLFAVQKRLYIFIKEEINGERKTEWKLASKNHFLQLIIYIYSGITKQCIEKSFVKSKEIQMLVMSVVNASSPFSTVSEYKSWFHYLLSNINTTAPTAPTAHTTSITDIANLINSKDHLEQQIIEPPLVELEEMEI